jgi:hypothetical protein
MMKAVPPLNEVFKQAGMDLPKFLGEETADVFAGVDGLEAEVIEAEGASKSPTSVAPSVA